MRHQTGFTLSGFLFWAVIISLVAILGVKVTPEYITYFKLLEAAKSVGKDATGKSVPEIRSEVGKYLEVNHLRDFSPADFTVSKSGNQVVLSFSYERQIHLFYNISLLIEFDGSSS